MRLLIAVSLFALVGCQSLTAPLTSASLPAPTTASGGQPRFPLQDSVADEVVVVEEVEAEEVVAEEAAPAAAAANTECKRPSLVSVNAVGNPCETTRSFWLGKGMTEAQIDAALSSAAH